MSRKLDGFVMKLVAISLHAFSAKLASSSARYFEIIEVPLPICVVAIMFDETRLFNFLRHSPLKCKCSHFKANRAIKIDFI